MDKYELMGVMALAAAAGMAFYGVIRELQPVFLAAIQFTGIILIIFALAICFGGLFMLISLFTDRNHNNLSVGSHIALDYMEMHRAQKINRLLLKEQLAAKREQLRLSELNLIEHTPDIIREGRFYS